MAVRGKGQGFGFGHGRGNGGRPGRRSCRPPAKFRQDALYSASRRPPAAPSVADVLQHRLGRHGRIGRGRACTPRATGLTTETGRTSRSAVDCLSTWAASAVIAVMFGHVAKLDDCASDAWTTSPMISVTRCDDVTMSSMVLPAD